MVPHHRGSNPRFYHMGGNNRAANNMIAVVSRKQPKKKTKTIESKDPNFPGRHGQGEVHDHLFPPIPENTAPKADAPAIIHITMLVTLRVTKQLSCRIFHRNRPVKSAKRIAPRAPKDAPSVGVAAPERSPIQVRIRQAGRKTAFRAANFSPQVAR